MRHRTLVLGTISALFLGLAGISWACTTQAYISVAPRSGEAGSQVVVNGEFFVKDGPVAIYWNSVGGHLLARTSGADFSIPVTIPDVAAGNYYIVAVGRDNPTSNRIAGKTSAAFRVTAPSTDATGPTGADRPPTGDTVGTTNGGAPQDQIDQGDEAFATTDGGDDSESQAVSAGRVSGRGSGADGRGSNRSAVTELSGSRNQPAASSASAPSSGLPGRSAASRGFASSTSPSRRSDLAGLVGLKARAGDSQQSSTEGRSIETNAPEVLTSMDGDLWSGFRSSTQASLVPGLVDGSLSHESTPKLTAGLALLASGLVVLMSGALVAQARRRRARAGAR